MTTLMNERRERLVLLLRIVGGVALLALPCMFLPVSWMARIHQTLGMGDLPAAPIVGYLARSTSAFYAVLGGLMWLCSCDLQRHELIVRFLAWMFVVLGVFLFIADFLEGLPIWWTFGEGIVDAGIGVTILILTNDNCQCTTEES
jgi:hypothetical protein